MTTDYRDDLPLLKWREEWRQNEGKGIVIGLLDSKYNMNIPDLIGADIFAKDFTGSNNLNPEICKHGTHSVTILMGQAHQDIRGITPRACLLVGEVVGPANIAEPQAVAQAIDWLISSNVQIIIAPLGSSTDYIEISKQIEKASNHGILFFAAAGNAYPAHLSFPARHPFSIAVGASDQHGNLLPECSRYPRLDVVAPGLEIPTFLNNQVIHRRSGSSVASIITAGVAALAFCAGELSRNNWFFECCSIVIVLRSLSLCVLFDHLTLLYTAFLLPVRCHCH
jgi:subtilisin family serine protease